MKRALGFGSFAVLVACSNTAPVADTAANAPKVAASAAPETQPQAPSPAQAAPASAEQQAPAWLPKPDFGARGPIVVEGFSRLVFTGMNDPAYVAGFSADGEWLGYCFSVNARDPGHTQCAMFPRNGATLTLSSDVADEYNAAAFKKLTQWVDEHAITKVPTGNMETPSAPPLRGDWAFAKDLTLVADEHAQGKNGAMVRIGGKVAGEKPVFPLSIDHPNGSSPHHRSWLNALALAPDGRDLGVVAGFFCMEYCNDYEVRRVPLVRLASQIYNDTGMRHHGAADYAGSAALFTKAVHADPTHPLAAYNLACAMARLRDPNTRAALEYAVQLGGKTVGSRAAKDADFANVRGEPWFAHFTQ